MTVKRNFYMSRTLHNEWLNNKNSFLDKAFYNPTNHLSKIFYSKHKKNRVQLRSSISKILKGDTNVILPKYEKFSLQLKKC